MEPKVDKFVELQHKIRHNQSELHDYLKDLDNWEDDIKKREEKLQSSKTAEESKLPPIRNAFEKKRKKKKVKERDGKAPAASAASKKISGFDFKAWDKFDVEAACAALDAEDDVKKSSSESDMETDEEWEIERMKQQAILEKERGNQYFKTGKYIEAVECYTKGIQCDPNNAILPANRAMALLKQEKFGAAEYDCTEALVLDPTYVKAYSRRGAARVGLGKLQKAKEDFEQVLKLEPKNKQAQLELEKIDKQLNPKPEATSLADMTTGIVRPITKPPHKRSKKPLVRIEIEEIGDEDNKPSILMPTVKSEMTSSERKLIEADNAKFESFMDELQTNKNKDNENKKPISIVELDDVAGDTKRLEVSGLEKADETKKIDSKSGRTTSPREPSRPPSLPPVPTTSYQFQTDWKTLKNHAELFAEYVKKIQPNCYTKIFGHSLDSDILNKLFQVYRDRYIPSNDDIYEELKALKDVKRFSMTVMFLSKSDKKVVEDLFDYLRNQSKHSIPEINDLAKNYTLS